MEEKENSGKTPAQTVFVFSKAKIKIFSSRFGLSLYSAQISKNTKIPSIPIIHEGQIGKNHKNESNGGQKGKKIYRKQVAIFAG